MEAPELSVILAATHDTQILRDAVDLHTAALEKVGGELLIADGTRDGLPPGLNAAVHMPDADVFELRAGALNLTAGRVIAITEDHCVPDPDWHLAVLRAHDEHPDIAAIGGAIFNGTADSAIDRANFLINFVSFLPPLPLRHPSRTSPPTKARSAQPS